MLNVLLDELPDGFECSSGNFYRLDFDFRVGVQVNLCLEDDELSETEKQRVVCELIYAESEGPLTAEDHVEVVEYYLNGWNHDKPGKRERRRLMDFDADQWRIYAAFLSQYRIDLNSVDMHYWAFMGLLTSLDECSYTRVIDVRRRPVENDMDKKAKRALMEAKEMYELRQTTTREEAEYEAYVDDLLCVDVGPQERERIRKFESFGKEGGEEKG